MNLLINATPAKYGGAKTIVERYLNDCTFNDYERVILLAPKNVSCNNDKVEHIHIETNGVWSWLFSIIGVLYFVLRYNAQKLISFNNVNLIIPVCKTITYYHTPHIFYSNHIRHKLLRFTIKRLMKRKHFVFQSNYVLNEFISLFDDNYEFSVNWCGCEKPIYDKTFAQKVNFNCIVPILDAYSDVKNFKFIAVNNDFISDLGITIKTLSSSGPKGKNINYLGMQTKENLFELYNSCDFMIMPSLYETVGLPIFEFAASGKPVLVLDKPYINGINETVGLTKNIIIFKPDDFHDVLKNLIDNYDDFVIDELPLNHPLVKSNWTALA